MVINRPVSLCLSPLAAATLLFAVDSDQTEAHHSTLAVPVFLHPFWHLSLHTEYTSQALQYGVD